MSAAAAQTQFGGAGRVNDLHGIIGADIDNDTLMKVEGHVARLKDFGFENTSFWFVFVTNLPFLKTFMCCVRK